MKRTIFVLTTVLFFALSLSSCKKDETNNNGGGGTYVNLGLPSGTKWKSTNETGGTNGFYTFDEAVSAFGDKLPTKEQFDELLAYCTWEWQNNNSYKVTGTNGKSIVLPAAGFRDTDGQVIYVGYWGVYWSSTPVDSESAFYLEFSGGDDPHVRYGYISRNMGMSVRLVKK